MSWITHLRVWYRRWRRTRAAKRQKSELREFVYLDEVSVYSLIASRLGPVAAEFTETETTSLERGFVGSFGATAGVAEAKLSPHRLETQTQGTQVLRKSIVQTTFKEFYELERDSLALRLVSDDAEPPEIRNPDDFEAHTKALADDGWIVDPENLVRGQLLEMEVQLETDPIFRVSTAISSFVEIVEKTPEVFGLGSYDQLVQARSINLILEKLLVGLVPVRGYAIDYRVVRIEEKEWIVHHKLLNKLETVDPLSTRPLYVVGVAEQPLFWKDIRRILFSDARFRVLCRMAQDGIQESWIPVKLSHVLESVVPGITSEFDALGSSVSAAMINASMPSPRAKPKQQLMRDALVGYAGLLAGHYGHELTASDSAEIAALAERHCVSFSSQKERREAFEEIATFLLDRLEVEREPSIVANYRADALADVGLCFTGQPMPLVTSNDLPSAAPSRERFLDSEFIAIYW